MALQKVTIQFPIVEQSRGDRPANCPRCGNSNLVRHGTLYRKIADSAFSRVSVQRYRCTSCGYAPRYLPTGVNQKKRVGKRLAAFAVFLRYLGLSSPGASRTIRETMGQVHWSTIRRIALESGIEDRTRQRNIKVRIIESEETPEPEESEVLLRFIEDPQTGQKVGVEAWKWSGEENLQERLEEKLLGQCS